MSNRPTLLRAKTKADLVLTCEHASCAVPEQLGDLGLIEELRRDHIGWDIGAAALTAELSERLSAPAVLSAVSRLIVDCNRSLTDDDLIPAVSHGVVIPANGSLGAEDRGTRLRDYYDPFHFEVDRALAAAPAAKLLSVHSFTPDIDGRDFDIGVLFDDCAEHAHRLSEVLEQNGFAVRLNQPYSGLEGLIFSAQSHGRRFRRPYLELEINNRLLRNAAAVAAVAKGVAAAVDQFVSATEPIDP